jgi:uncharacterized membrane protein
MAVCFFATQGFSDTLWGTLVSAVASFFVSNSIMYLLYSKSMYFGSIGELLKKARVAFSAQ